MKAFIKKSFARGLSYFRPPVITNKNVKTNKNEEDKNEKELANVLGKGSWDSKESYHSETSFLTGDALANNSYTGIPLSMSLMCLQLVKKTTHRSA